MAPRFETRAELHAWLEQEGLAHVGRFNLEAVAPFVDESSWPQLRAFGARRRLTELADLKSAPEPLRAVLADAVHAFIEHEEAEAERARGEVASRLMAPAGDSRAAIHARLLGLRAQVPPSVAPRPGASLHSGLSELVPSLSRDGRNGGRKSGRSSTSSDRPVAALQFDRALPGFTWKDWRPTERALRAGGGFAHAEVKLTLLPENSKAECSCALGPCVHVLAAIDTALLSLPSWPQHVLDELARPPWQRTLAALEKALEKTPAPRADLELRWGFAIEDDFVSIRPLMESMPRGGEGLRHALLTSGRLTARDAHLAALLPEEGEPASRALLEALVDHPAVVLESSPEQFVHIERAAVGLVAEERLGSVKVSAGLEGAPLPPYLAERVRQAQPDELVFLWDPGPRRFTLLDFKPELQAVLGLLQREHAVFPPESYAALLDSLSKWSQRLPVAMPRTVLGESVPPQVLPVLRLEARPRGAVDVEVRVKALPDAPALVPGQGARDVHLRRANQAFHTVRDLAREVTVAKALSTELGLEEFQTHFDRPEDVLALVEACAKKTPPPAIEWVGTPLRVLGGTGPRALRVQVEDRIEWFGVLGSLSVEGERVELARLLEAARRRSRWVQVTEHGWVELNEVLRRHLERVADHVRVTKQGQLLVGPAATEPLRALQAAGATLEADASWTSLAERIEAARSHTPKPPRGLNATLRPYQLEGYQWLSRLAAWGAGAVLADDMGLGKTLQTLALLLERASKGPALVVAPTSVAFNWQDEARRFAPSLKVHHYAEDRTTALGPGDVVIVSYGLLVRDAKVLSKRAFATIVFDEAQNLKNAQTQRFHAANALRGEFKVALSGTPVENHLGELWSLFALVFPPLLGPWEGFREKFAMPIERNVDPAAAPALGRLIEPFLLRRTKAEVATELPPRTEVRVPVVLSAEEWELYEDTRLAALSDLETPKRQMKEQERKLQVLALLTRLRLVASHPRLHVKDSTLESSKLNRLLELLDELGAEGQRSLVFSQFTSHLSLVKEALDARGITSVWLDGSTPRAQRALRVREFEDGTAPVFLLSLKAGGVGLNLTAATTVIHLDPWWNPAVEDQASDRAHRLGQKRPVTVYRLVAKDTVEEQMLALHERKRSMVDKVLAGKARAATLSADELVALLQSRG